jgi:hypothetical protein
VTRPRPFPIHSGNLLLSGEHMRLLALLLILVLAMPASPWVLTSVAQGETASVAGTATSSTGETLINATVQLRDLATGTVTATTTSSSTGAFSFAAVNPGNYVVEVLNAAGQVVGTSASISVAAGAVVTGVMVTATAAAVAATAAAAGVGTIVAVTSAAVAAGVVGIAAASGQGDASPSR